MSKSEIFSEIIKSEICEKKLKTHKFPRKKQILFFGKKSHCFTLQGLVNVITTHMQRLNREL